MKENKENDQVYLAQERTRLANERTLLAWFRTGLASVGGGIAIIKLLKFYNSTHEMVAETMGALLVVVGICMFLFASIDYRRSCEWLKMSRPYAGSIWMVHLFTAVLIFVSVALLVIEFS